MPGTLAIDFSAPAELAPASFATIDGRLHNRTALIDALALAAGATDADILLAAWRRWNTGCGPRLLGEFSGVVWDADERCAAAIRDALGTRGMCYAHRGARFAVASWPGPLLELPWISRRLDEGFAGEVLAGGPFTEGATLFSDIRRIPPGTIVVARTDRLSLSRYWSPFEAPPLRHASDDEYAEALRQTLEEAVRCRTAGQVRGVAVFLSGGIDSSALTGLAAEQHRRGVGPPVHAFSLVFPGQPAADERSYARAAAATAGVPLHERRATPPSAARFGDQAVRYGGLPDLPNDDMARELRQDVARAGFQVVLGGAGADALFGGSLFEYTDLARARAFATLARRAWTDYRTGDLVPSQLAHVAWPLLPAMVRRRLRPLALSLSGAGRTGSWIRPEFAARISLADRLSAQPSARARGGHAADEIARQLQAPLHGFVLEGGSRVYDEHGLQPADPFLDRRVVEFGLGLPPQQRTRDGLSKYVLRRAASGWLPEAVAARRTKADFGHVCVSALEALGGERFFGSLSLAARGWVDGPTTIARYGSLRQLYAAGDPSYGDMIHSLWNTAAVELAVRAAEPGGPHEERERTASAV